MHIAVGILENCCKVRTLCFSKINCEAMCGDWTWVSQREDSGDPGTSGGGEDGLSSVLSMRWRRERKGKEATKGTW